MDKKVIIAIPLKRIRFEGQTLVASFMEIDMQRMLEGVSLQADANKMNRPDVQITRLTSGLDFFAWNIISLS